MPIDIFRRTPTASKKITNVSIVSLGYVKNNFLRKRQETDMTGKTI